MKIRSRGFFSFNNPVGACPNVSRDSEELSVLTWILWCRIPGKTIRQWSHLTMDISTLGRENFIDLLRVAKDVGFPVDVPFSELTKEQLADSDERL
jgi:excinuclease UvrABC ATPase subunit